MHIQRNPDGSLMYPWYDPRNIELGITEAAQAYAAPNTAMSDQHGSNLLGEGSLTPVAPNDLRNISGTEAQWTTPVSGLPISTGYGDEGYDRAVAMGDKSSGYDTTGKTQNVDYFINEFGEPQPITNNDGGGQSEAQRMAEILRQQQELARQKYAALMGEVEGAYNRAKSRRDDALSMVKKRQEEFGDLRDEDILNISDTFEEKKGNTRRTASDLALQAGNRARAMGGQNMSGMMGVPSRMDEALYRQMGSLNQTRGRNERGAQRLYDQRQDWATGQLGNIEDTFGAATDARNAAGRLNAIDYAQNLSGLENQVGNYMSNIIAQQNALAAANQGAQSYQANPYGIDLSGIQNTLSAFQPGISQAAGNARSAAANANITNPSMIAQVQDWRKNVPGGNLYQAMA